MLRILVRYRAWPLPGFTKSKATTRYGSPSSIIFNPFFKSATVYIRSSHSVFMKQHKPSRLDGPVHISRSVDSLLGAVGNTASTEIVRRKLDSNLVAGKNLDKIFTHFAGNMSKN